MRIIMELGDKEEVNQKERRLNMEAFSQNTSGNIDHSIYNIHNIKEPTNQIETLQKNRLSNLIKRVLLFYFALVFPCFALE